MACDDRMLLKPVLASSVATPDLFTGNKYKIQEGISPVSDPLFVLLKTSVSIYYRSLTPNETTNAYAKFRGLSFNSFRFKIVAANEKGYSKDVSEVYVPSKTESKFFFLSRKI